MVPAGRVFTGVARSLPKAWDHFYRRRGRHGVWPHRQNVRLQPRRYNAGYSLRCQRDHGGYLPLAATLTTEEIFAAFLGEYKEFKTFFHGHTYTGNPLGCAVAIANLELFAKEDVVERMQPGVAMLQQRLRDEFSALPHVSDVRQWGYMVGIELAQDAATRQSYPPEKRIGHQVILEARKRSVMIRPLGDVIILMPPLSITDAELSTLLDVVYDCIDTVTGN